MAKKYNEHNSFAGYSIIQKIKKHHIQFKLWSTAVTGYLLIRVEDYKDFGNAHGLGCDGERSLQDRIKHKHKSKEKEKREKEKQPKDKQPKERNVCFYLAQV